MKNEEVKTDGTENEQTVRRARTEDVLPRGASCRELTNGQARIRRKARSDAKLHALEPRKRELLEQWLFLENLSYKQVSDLCEQQLGVEASDGAVRRYYEREESRWKLEQKTARLFAQDKEARRVGDAETQYRELLSRMIRVALKTADAAQTPLEQRLVTDYAKVVISARRESHEALRAATTREKFEFDAATECLVHQVKIAATAADEALDDAERIQKIREELFGTDLPPAEGEV